MTRIDGHAHLPLDHPELAGVLEDADLRVLNVCVDTSGFGNLDAQRAWYARLHAADPQRFSWCTSFSARRFGEEGWVEHTLEQLEHDLTVGGATACKVWKSIGMELRDPATGDYVFVDDDRLAPVYDYLARRRVTLLAHIGEPLACWQPLDPDSPHCGYYTANPEWHWHNRPDVPTHAHLMEGRDRMVSRHPDLVVIGAHFGSHEYDLNEVASRLERFANFNVDTSARLADVAALTRRDRDAVRKFFLRFSDRIVWGVDCIFTKPASAMDPEVRRAAAIRLREQYELERRFYATDEEVLIHGRPVSGLALPPAVIGQIMRSNAERLYAMCTRAGGEL